MKTLLRNSKFLTATFLLLSLFFVNTKITAQVTFLNNWSNVYHGTSTAAQTSTYTVPAGSNARRILVVGIASSTTASNTRSVTLTYGTQTPSASTGDMGSNNIQHTQLYYFNEAKLDAATSTTLSVQVSNGTTSMTDVWVAVLDGVDQSAPVTNSQNYNSGATAVDPFQFGTGLTVNSYDQAIEIISTVRVGNNNERAIDNYPIFWVSGASEQLGSYNPSGNSNDQGIRNAMANPDIPTSTVTDVSSVNLSGSARASMTAYSFKECTPATANAGSALTAICKGGVSAALGGSIGGPATSGTWSSSVAGGTFTPNATTLNATWDPPIAFTGAVTLTLTPSGGSCGSVAASKSLYVGPLPTVVTATPSTTAICTGGTVNLTSSATFNSPTVPLLSESFTAAPPGWTTTNTSINGTPANAAWTLRANGYNYASGTIFNSNDTSQFYLSNSDDQGSGSTTNTTLQSPAFSTVGLSAASLTFYHFYDDFDTDDFANVEISTNGTSWTTLNSNTYTTDQGTRTGFVLVTSSLASYLGQATVYIRFRYTATYGYYWAIDNVQVTGTVIPTSYAWTSTPSGYTSSTQNPTGVAPTVATTYTVTATNSYGCTASATTASVAVNAVPVSGTLTPTPAAGAVCSGISVSATATAGSGGAGTIADELQVSLSGGAFTAYTSGTSISTTGQTSVSIRTRRTATASGCTSSSYNTVTWTNTVKTYNGSWSPSAPTSNTDAAVISSNYNVAGNITACSLTVNSSAVVTIPTGSSVTLAGPLTVSSGSFTLENNAYLVQEGTTNTNSGNITVKRNSSLIMRLDYTLWSSPVASQELYDFSPLTLSTRFYKYLTLSNVYNNSLGFTISGADVNGIGGTDTSNVTFDTAKGYLIRTPWNHPTAPTVWTGQFTGIPNSGDIDYTLETTGTGFNAIGNPYPSPVAISTFLTNNSSKIASTLWFWRKTNNPNNLISPTTSYITYSGGTYSSGSATNYNIQPGQGFIVQATASGNVNFKNTQRVTTDGLFFRNNSQTESAGEGRLWLNLKRDTELAGSIAIGYKDGATNDLDTEFDGKYINDSSLALTSLIQGEELAVQHRATPFADTDIVPLSFKTGTAGNYTIEFNGTDGTLDSQDIYLEDLLLNQSIAIKTTPYTFTSAAGNFAERFRIVYVDNALGTDNPSFTSNQVIIYKNEVNDFVINSGTVMMASVKVFDIRGRLLVERKGIDASQTTMTVGMSNEVLLVQITSVDGEMVTKKVVR